MDHAVKYFNDCDNYYNGKDEDFFDSITITVNLEFGNVNGNNSVPMLKY